MLCRDCAVKDAALRTMFDDLMAAEEQHRVALHNHLRQMDRLIELQVRSAPQFGSRGLQAAWGATG